MMIGTKVHRCCPSFKSKFCWIRFTGRDGIRQVQRVDTDLGLFARRSIKKTRWSDLVLMDPSKEIQC